MTQEKRILEFVAKQGVYPFRVLPISNALGIKDAFHISKVLMKAGFRNDGVGRWSRPPELDLRKARTQRP